MTTPSEFVRYRTNSGRVMRARVVRRHRNGDVTVEPWFFQDGEGRDTGPFQGGWKLRVEPASLLASKPESQPA